MPISDAPRTAGGIVDPYWGPHVTSTFADMLEHVPDLTWPLSVQTYGKMRHDPRLKAIMQAVVLPLRRGAHWAVDPDGCRPEVAQLVADDFGLPVLGGEDAPAAARRRGVCWPEHLRLALLMLTFGHMCFACRYEIRDGRARLAELSERLPHTIFEIQANGDGTLAGIRQNFAGADLIPAKNLLWYSHEREGSAWQGVSLLRPAFGPWLIKHDMLRVLGSSNRRFGMGTPVVNAPPGGTPQQVLEAQRLASAWRGGEQSGVGLPPGFAAQIVGVTGGAPDTLSFVRYLDEQMSQMALAGWMDLGQSAYGSRALGETFVDVFMLSLQAIAEEIAEAATSLAVRSVDWNWGEDEPAPRIVVSDVGSSYDVTAESLNLLLGSGALGADPALETYVRQRWQLPDRDPQVPWTPPKGGGGQPALPAAPPSPGTYAGDAPAQPVAAAAGDPDPAHAAHAAVEAAVARLAKDWVGVTAAQRDALTEQIQAAVDAGDFTALANLQVDPAQGVDLLAQHMADMATAAARATTALAQAQGAPLTDPPPVDETQLGAVAATMGALLAAGLASAAARKALQLATPGASGGQVAAAVAEHLDSLSGTYTADHLGGALHAAQQQGRMAVMQAAPPASIQAREITPADSGECEPCREVNGRVFGSLTEAAAAYATGGYVKCDGYLRCRGILVASWAPEQAPAAQAPADLPVAASAR